MEQKQKNMLSEPCDCEKVNNYTILKIVLFYMFVWYISVIGMWRV